MKPLALTALTAAAAIALSSPIAAQPLPTEHVRGQITAADDSSITLKTRAGATVRLAFTPDLRVTSLTKVDFSEVKAGTYVGIAAVVIRPAPRRGESEAMKNPTHTALDLVIFPESMKGTDEGQRKWDLTPDSTMTNGTVYDLEARDLSIRFKGNERDVHVPPKAPVVKIAPGDKQLLKPGAHIFVVAQKGANGQLTAQRISVGRDGLVPPM